MEIGQAYWNSDKVIAFRSHNTLKLNTSRLLAAPLGKKSEMVSCFSTLRQLTVLDVLKGEDVGETITYANMGISMSGDDGNEVIMWLPENEFIQKQNVKYIFYLSESTREDGTYYAASDQGVINIDGLDENGSRG